MPGNQLLWNNSIYKMQISLVGTWSTGDFSTDMRNKASNSLPAKNIKGFLELKSIAQPIHC